MTSSAPRLELEEVLRDDVAEILAARERVRIVHATADISAAGNELEDTCRRVIDRKLADAYYVGHGHIVDASWHTSPQLDVVIADNLNAPVLFQAKDGTSYFPYESVYAIGEIKTSYRRGAIDEFVSHLDAIRSNLKRNDVPLTQISRGVRLSGGMSVSMGTRTHRNPMFSFMLFVDPTEFDPKHVGDLYKGRPSTGLPNVVCLLGRGLILNAAVRDDGDVFLGINVNPEFSVPVEGQTNRWMFLEWNEAERLAAATWAFLFFAISEHLARCALGEPDLQAYLLHVFRDASGFALT